MLLIERRIWKAQAVSADTTFESVEPQLTHSLSFILTVAGSGFSGSFDIQGREDPNGTWANISYREIDTGGEVGSLLTEALSFTAFSDTKRYLIPIAPTQVRLSLSLNAGTIDAWVRGSGTPIFPQTGNSPANYFKLSTETRPGNPYFDANTSVSVGATLLEYDTGNLFVYVGSQRGWVKAGAPTEETQLERILEELRSMREIQELVLLGNS